MVIMENNHSFQMYLTVEDIVLLYLSVLTKREIEINRDPPDFESVKKYESVRDKLSGEVEKILQTLRECDQEEARLM